MVKRPKGSPPFFPEGRAEQAHRSAPLSLLPRAGARVFLTPQGCLASVPTETPNMPPLKHSARGLQRLWELSDTVAACDQRTGRYLRVEAWTESGRTTPAVPILKAEQGKRGGEADMPAQTCREGPGQPPSWAPPHLRRLHSWCLQGPEQSTRQAAPSVGQAGLSGPGTTGLAQGETHWSPQGANNDHPSSARCAGRGRCGSPSHLRGSRTEHSVGSGQ